jgi:membrane AbrB-like protein
MSGRWLLSCLEKLVSLRGPFLHGKYIILVRAKDARRRSHLHSNKTEKWKRGLHVATKFESGFRNLIFILISGMGGFLLSLTGLSIGWMIGTLITAGVLSFLNLKPVTRLFHGDELAGYWLKAGQLLLGIQIGQEISISVLGVLDHGWLSISIMILISILLSLASGWLLYHFSKTDLITSLYGTTPGGLSSMLGIATDVGANMAVVSIIQTMRVILVECTIPLIVSVWRSGMAAGSAANTAQSVAGLNPATATGLLLLSVVAVLGAVIGKKIHLPASWLLGSMLSVGLVQALYGLILGRNLSVWWPHELIIVAQVMLGACVGSRLNRELFNGVVRTVIVGLIGTLGLMAAMFLCALAVSWLSGIDAITSILAFAPGGIDVMAVTAVVLHADATFVVAVQVIRLLAICILLPPLFSLINRRQQKISTSRS